MIFISDVFVFFLILIVLSCYSGKPQVPVKKFQLSYQENAKKCKRKVIVNMDDSKRMIEAKANTN